MCIVQFDESGEGTLLELDAYADSPAGFANRIAGFEGNVIAAIDAPLVIGVERTAERQLARVFGKAKASAYTANEAFLAGFNGLAGPLLMAELRDRGFEHGPPVPGHGRSAVEVYPHAAHVALFALPERILYKRGRLDSRRAGMRLYQLYLARHLASHWPWAATDERIISVLDPDAVNVPGKALKHLEDRLDAITCAYAGWHIATHGLAGTHVFGDALNGLIAVPRWPVPLA